MNDEEELELIDAFEVEDKTKEFVPVGEKQVLPTRRETHRRTREIPVEENQELQQQETPKKVKIEKQQQNKQQLNIDIQEEPQHKKTVRKLKKGLVAQTAFCMLSIFFIIGCFIFYGNRFIKYYRIYNPKDANGNVLALLSNTITSSSTFVYEGDGLYLINGNYLYKGLNENNYVEYSGFTWRILKINEDKTIDLVLDSNINTLKWNDKVTEYKNSDIQKYLNNEFLPLLDKDYLVNTTICKDVINDIDSISCNDIDQSEYVRLLSIDEYLNSKVNNNSFLSDGSSIWLVSRGTEKVWAINDQSVSFAEPNKTYNVKPVVTLKNSTAVISGDGSKEKPYVIEEKNENKLVLGSHIKLDKDIWTVYKIEKDELYLVSTKVLDKQYRFDVKTNKYDPSSKYSLAEYLNTTYYNSLSYKDKLLEVEWEIGQYNNSYKDIEKEKVKAKVGIPSVKDFKYETDNSYFMINGTEDNTIYMFDELLIESKVDLYRNIKPTICIKKTSIVSGNGSIDNPFVLGE